MKVELKRLSISTRLSEETTAFAADVYIDGKKAGHAKNDGCGGATFVRIEDRALAQKLKDFGKTQVPAKYASFTAGDEWVVDQLVEQAVVAKESARIAKLTAKNDAKFKLTCTMRGTHAARFTFNGQDIGWTEFRDDESAARKNAEKKYGALNTWTVIA